METTKIVTYYRVSTDKQGLGIDAQRAAVAEYLQMHPELEEIATYTETYTGKEENRPEFSKAVDLCKRSGAVLLAAKLDRLGRGKFLYGLLSDNTFKFKVLDIAGNSDLERTIRIAIAIEERNAISSRTSSALQAKASILRKAREAYEAGDVEGAKRYVESAEFNAKIRRGFDWWLQRDFKLGTKRSTADGTMTAGEVRRLADRRRAKADTNDNSVMAANAVRIYLKQGGVRKLSKIATYLNESYYRTPRGKEWAPQSVKNLLERFDI